MKGAGGEKDVFVQVENLACVLKKSQNRKKFICKNAYTFLCVHIKMHIFQDQSQEAFDAFVHLWLVHLYFSFLRVKSLLFDVIGTWRNQLHQKTYSCIENFLDDSIDEMTNAGISHLSNLTMKKDSKFFLGKYAYLFSGKQKIFCKNEMYTSNDLFIKAHFMFGDVLN